MSNRKKSQQQEFERVVAKLVVLAGCVVAAACLAIWVGYQDFIADTSLRLVCVDQHLDNGIEFQADAELFEPGEFHGALKIRADIQGLIQPPTWEIDQVDPPLDIPVAGFVVSGQPYAFALDHMAQPNEAIINMTIRGVAVSVSYCNLVDSLRVLTHPDRSEPTPLRVGGLDTENRMVLLLDGVRYAHESDALPLQDLPFERMSFGDWRHKHPNSRIFMRAARHFDPENSLSMGLAGSR